MSDKPDIVYGRLLESAHISGYGFERMVDELEWLLDGDRWQQVGPGHTDVNTFLKSIDLSAFNLTDKKRLHKRIKELQPQASTRAIGKATGTPHKTVHDHVRDRTVVAESTPPDQDKHKNGVRVRTAFDRDSATVADLARQATKRADREAEREQERERNRALTLSVDPPTGLARTLVIDPPWDFGDEGDVDVYGRANVTYATQTIDEIAAMPFGEWAEPDAHLYLWITNRSLRRGFDLIERWGFRYVTCLTWAKPNYGMGNYYRGQTEHVLFGVRGSLGLLRKDVGTALIAPRPPGHSVKPDEFYELIETCSPGPWLDIYARRGRPGWQTWGAEA